MTNVPSTGRPILPASMATLIRTTGSYQRRWLMTPSLIACRRAAASMASQSARLAAIGYDRWAVLEWECCLKNAEDGAREGAAFIRDHIIRVTDKAFDDFAGGAADPAQARRMLGLGRD